MSGDGDGGTINKVVAAVLAIQSDEKHLLTLSNTNNVTKPRTRNCRETMIGGGVPNMAVIVGSTGFRRSIRFVINIIASMTDSTR